MKYFEGLEKSFCIDKKNGIKINLLTIFDSHGLDGKACLLKTFCDATKMSNSLGNKKMGMLFKVFQVIFA